MAQYCSVAATSLLCPRCDYVAVSCGVLLFGRRCLSIAGTTASDMPDGHGVLGALAVDGTIERGLHLALVNKSSWVYRCDIIDFHRPVKYPRLGAVACVGDGETARRVVRGLCVGGRGRIGNIEGA